MRKRNFIMIFIIVLLLSCGKSIAKSIEQIIIKSEAEIAEPILVIENQPSLELTRLKNFGIYSFKIKNYDKEEKITQTDFKYYIEIISREDEYMNVELYENDNKIELYNKKTEYITISKNQKEEKQYKVKVSYTDILDEQEDITDKIAIKVHAEQIEL